MPKKYKRQCDTCKEPYSGYGSKYCSVVCSLTGRPVSIDTKQKLRKANLGRKMTEQDKEKMRQAKLGKRGNSTGHSWSMSEQAKEKISKGIIAFYDKKGRREYERHIHLNKSKPYIAWRTSVFERDDYTCQGCGQVGGYLEAHHIKSWAYYPEHRFDITNGLTLCKPCHSKTDNYRRRASTVGALSA